ncbi:hypothetical protein ACOZ35_04140 [Halorubrum xinjiangense]|uniref:hypothetical protein n=1 Tax=Halorubrum xinjiangense TaxID=261291 RepID=UPI003C6EADB2
MISDLPDVNDYAERFHSNKKARFKERYEEILDDNKVEEIKPSVQTDISLEQEHVDLVRAVSSGFHQTSRAPGSESGFKFSCVDPLSEEVGLDNGADVLLARTREFSRVQLCVVACEVDDSTVPSWISNINSIHSTFSDPSNRDKILDQIGAGSKTLDEIQYITLIKPEDYGSLSFSELNGRCNPSEYAVWSVKKNGMSEICHEGGELIHKELLDVIQNCFDYDVAENPIEYTLGTDQVVPLSNVVYRLVRGKDIYEDAEEPLEFTRSEFKSKFAEKLKLSTPEPKKDEMIDSAVRDMLTTGVQIGIFSKSSPKLDRSDYRIMYKGSDDAKTAEDAVFTKYIEKVAENRLQIQAFEQAKSEFSTGQKGLSDFSSTEVE